MSGVTPQSAQQERNVAQAGEAYTAKAYAAGSPTSALAPFSIRAP